MMLSPLCSMWPLLAALLFGWLLCGWFARQFLRSPDRFGASSSVSPAPRATGGSGGPAEARRVEVAVQMP